MKNHVDILMGYMKTNGYRFGSYEAIKSDDMFDYIP